MERGIILFLAVVVMVVGSVGVYAQISSAGATMTATVNNTAPPSGCS